MYYFTLGYNGWTRKRLKRLLFIAIVIVFQCYATISALAENAAAIAVDKSSIEKKSGAIGIVVDDVLTEATVTANGTVGYNGVSDEASTEGETTGGSSSNAGVADEAAAAISNEGSLSLEEAVEFSRSWVCGMNSEAYILFVNPKSGSRQGGKFIRDGNSKSVQLKGECADVYIYPLTDAKGAWEAVSVVSKRVLTLKALEADRNKLINRSDNSAAPVARIRPQFRRVRVIAVGGDGTFTAMMEMIMHAGIDTLWIAAGIFATGTGNDLARNYGWVDVKYPYGDPLVPHNLSQYVRLWRSALVTRHDSWTVEIETKGKDGFEAWDPNLRKRVLMSEEHNGIGAYKAFPMNIYFGLGFDGMVGSAFEVMRGNSRIWNRLMYGVALLRHLPSKVTDVCSSIDSIIRIKNHSRQVIISNNNRYLRVPRLKPCISLTMINVKSIWGGWEIWKMADSVGLEPPADPQEYNAFTKFSQALRNRKTRSGDGSFELFAISGKQNYLTSPVMPNKTASRLMQTEGPVSLTFADDIESLPAQVDGEFFSIRFPRRITISRRGTFFVLFRKK